MTKLNQLISQLEANIGNADYLNTNVSASSVGWHIEHSLLVLNGVAAALVKSNPAEYKWKFSIWKMIVFATNKMPRGRAKSPASVLPKGGATKESLLALLNATNNKLAALEVLPPNHWFRHPIFGKLNVILL